MLELVQRLRLFVRKAQPGLTAADGRVSRHGHLVLHGRPALQGWAMQGWTLQPFVVPGLGGVAQVTRGPREISAALLHLGSSNSRTKFIHRRLLGARCGDLNRRLRLSNQLRTAMRWVLSILFFAPAQGILFKDAQQAQRSRIETCSPLKNHLTYSSVKVSIGTPPQYFHLVADTGSNNCIVKDCACTECPKSWGNCFTGQDKSKSFDLPLFKVQDEGDGSAELKQKGAMAPAALVMSFGSGQIAAQIASDEVGIGSVRTYMDKGLLLMDIKHLGIISFLHVGHEQHETKPNASEPMNEDRAADDKLKRAGEKAHAEMIREAAIAKARLEKHETLTALQKTAVEFVHENRYIKIHELPAEFEKDRMRILHHEVGVCSGCRNQSGCLNCDEFKCIRAYMRREHKKTGRPIEPQYQ
eukprot:Skav218446  [mRNA]  locus=scaffold905:143422:158045:+ [translate_table: standard]